MLASACQSHRELENDVNRQSKSKLVLMLGACCLVLVARMGTASAAVAVPELDPGSAGSGIALTVGAALLLAERYRRRR
jgi:hypothetical protein